MFEELQEAVITMFVASDEPMFPSPPVDLYHYQTLWASLIALVGAAVVLVTVRMQLSAKKKEDDNSLKALCRSLRSEGENFVSVVIQTPIAVVEAKGRLWDLHLRPPQIYETFLSKVGELPGDLPDAVVILWGYFSSYVQQIESRNLSLQGLVEKQEANQTLLDDIEVALVQSPESRHLQEKRSALRESLQYGRKFLNKIEKQNDQRILELSRDVVDASAIILPWLEACGRELEALSHEEAKLRFHYDLLVSKYEQYQEQSRAYKWSMQAEWRQ